MSGCASFTECERVGVASSVAECQAFFQLLLHALADYRGGFKENEEVRFFEAS